MIIVVEHELSYNAAFCHIYSPYTRIGSKGIFVSKKKRIDTNIFVNMIIALNIFNDLLADKQLVLIKTVRWIL